jgi:hypothetical protein
MGNRHILVRMVLTNRAGLPAAEHAALERALGAPTNLQQVVRWGLAHRPPLIVVDVVTQDEFTHDVVLPWRDALYLVFDTT